jgi:multiple sugar transport system permease protein
MGRHTVTIGRLQDTKSAGSPGRAPAAATRGTRSRRRLALRRDRLTYWAFLSPALLYLVAFFVFPVVRNVLISFQNYSVTSLYTGQAPYAGLANYRAIFDSGLFSGIVVNTAIFTVCSMAGQFVIGLGLAVFFSRRFPLNGVIRALLLLPWLLPMVASTTVWRWLLDQDSGALNRTLAALHITAGTTPWLAAPHFALVSVILVNIWVGIPFNMVILYGGLREIPDELYEAAALDGTGPFSRFRYITWPLLRPVTGVVVVLGFVYTVKVIDIILVLTGGGPANGSLTLAVQSYKLSFQNFAFGQGAAMSNVLIVVALIFAVIYLRINKQAFTSS